MSPINCSLVRLIAPPVCVFTGSPVRRTSSRSSETDLWLSRAPSSFPVGCDAFSDRRGAAARGGVASHGGVAGVVARGRALARGGAGCDISAGRGSGTTWPRGGCELELTQRAEGRQGGGSSSRARSGFVV